MPLREWFKKKYYHKEMKCPSCHETNFPIVRRNRLGTQSCGYPHAGLDNDSTYRKYLLVCPKCKFIMSSAKKP